jgi:hypothetical protein
MHDPGASTSLYYRASRLELKPDGHQSQAGIYSSAADDAERVS